MRLLGLTIATACLVIGTVLAVAFSFWPVLLGGIISFLLLIVGVRIGLFG